VTIREEAGTARPVYLIAAQVSSPVSAQGPCRTQVQPRDTAWSVRLAAMNHFQVSDGADYTYVLTHGGHDLSDSQTIGQIADEKYSMEFRLVKKITQGWSLIGKRC
jgi:hypothetical protein